MWNDATVSDCQTLSDIFGPALEKNFMSPNKKKSGSWTTRCIAVYGKTINGVLQLHFTDIADFMGLIQDAWPYRVDERGTHNIHFLRYFWVFKRNTHTKFVIFPTRNTQKIFEFFLGQFLCVSVRKHPCSWPPSNSDMIYRYLRMSPEFLRKNHMVKLS